MPVPTDPTPNFVPGTLADADLVDARFKKLYDTLDPAVNGLDEANVRTGGLWTASAALPVAPRDGQECYLLADAATSTVWHMRYRAATGKWEYVGGRALEARVATSELMALALNTWGDVATLGPSITVPLAGDYDLEFGADLIVGSNGQGVQAGIAQAALGNAVAPFIGMVAAIAQVSGSLMTTSSMTALAANQVLRMRYRVQSVAGGTPTVANRWLKIRPWRL